MLTLRSDFEPQFARSPLEGDWMASRVVVPAMTLDEYRETIEGPASVKVLYFQGKTSSQEFINRLIGDVANTPGALPLLSFTLSELYRRYLQRGGDDRALWEEDYEALGRCGRVVAEPGRGGVRRAPRRRDARDDAASDAADDLGRSRRDRPPARARRRSWFTARPDENARVAEVVRRLTEARLVVEGKETDDRPYVEPAHDELVRGWDKLLTWSREEAEGLQLRRRLAPAAAGLGARPGRGSGRPIPACGSSTRSSARPRLAQRGRNDASSGEAGSGGGPVRPRSPLGFRALGDYNLVPFDEQRRAREQTPIAVQNEKTAILRQFAALSGSERNKRLDRSLLLAIEALKPIIPSRQEMASSTPLKTVRESGHFWTSRKAQSTAWPSAPMARSSPPDTTRQLAAWCSGTSPRDHDGPDSRSPSRRAMSRASPSAPKARPSRPATAAPRAAVWCSGTSPPQQRVAQDPLPVKEGDVNSVAFSPDGKTIAAGYGRRGGGGVVLWDMATRASVWPGTLTVKEGGVNSVAFAPDGKTIAAGYGGCHGTRRRRGAMGRGHRERLVGRPLAVKEGLRQERGLQPGRQDHRRRIQRRRRIGGVVLWDVATRKRLADAPTPRQGGLRHRRGLQPRRQDHRGRVRRQRRRGGVVVWDVATRKRLADEPLRSRRARQERGLQPRRQDHRGRIRHHSRQHRGRGRGLMGRGRAQTPGGRAARRQGWRCQWRGLSAAMARPSRREQPSGQRRDGAL